MSRLSPLQRAYLAGFRRGYQLAAFDTRRDAESIVNRLKDEVRTEMSEIRSDLRACRRSKAPPTPSATSVRD